MLLYEYVFILCQDLFNVQVEGLVEYFLIVLIDNGGVVVGFEYWGVKIMVYKINKNCKGYYVFLCIDVFLLVVQEMECLMCLYDDVMCVLIIKVDVYEEGLLVQMQKCDDCGDCCECC